MATVKFFDDLTDKPHWPHMRIIGACCMVTSANAVPTVL